MLHGVTLRHAWLRSAADVKVCYRDTPCVYQGLYYETVGGIHWQWPHNNYAKISEQLVFGLKLFP